MTSFVICPNRDNRKVSLEVCLSRCEEKHQCVELAEVSSDDLEPVAKKLKIPLDRPKELERVINLKADPAGNTEGSQYEHDCGKSLVTDRNDYTLAENSKRNLVPVKPELVPGNGKAKKAMELYEKLLILKKDVGSRLIEMGQILNEFYDNKYYLDIGYNDWNQFCSEALDFTARWALDIRKIALKKNQLKLLDHEVAEVGVKKMAQLLPVMTDKRTADHWIREAKKPGVTTERLIAKVRQARGRITQEEAEKVPVKYILPVYEEDVETVERAFELAREITGSNSRGLQFVGVCDGFRAEYEHESGDFDRKRIINGMIKSIERLLKIRFREVIDMETGEIIDFG